MSEANGNSKDFPPLLILWPDGIDFPSDTYGKVAADMLREGSARILNLSMGVMIWQLVAGRWELLEGMGANTTATMRNSRITGPDEARQIVGLAEVP